MCDSDFVSHSSMRRLRSFCLYPARQTGGYWTVQDSACWSRGARWSLWIADWSRTQFVFIHITTIEWLHDCRLYNLPSSWEEFRATAASQTACCRLRSAPTEWPQAAVMGRRFRDSNRSLSLLLHHTEQENFN